MERLLLVFIFNLALVYSNKLPDYIHICHRSDPQINECIKQSLEELRPNLIKGMPELKVPSIEPLYIEELVATEGTGLKIITRDLKAYGGSNFTCKHIDIDVNNGKYDFSLSFPHLHIEGRYDVDGKIMMIPIKGQGDMQADAYDVSAGIKLDSELFKKDDGEEYIKFTGMKMDFNVGKGKVHLDNLFGGDKLIGDVINAAINLNFQFFMKELTPTVIASLTDFVLKTANHIIQDVPFSNAFPE